jgi:hypothetical protein
LPPFLLFALSSSYAALIRGNVSPEAKFPWYLLMQNQHLAPSTQQAEQSWLNTRAGSEACQSIFLKLTKDEK